MGVKYIRVSLEAQRKLRKDARGESDAAQVTAKPKGKAKATAKGKTKAKVKAESGSAPAAEEAMRNERFQDAPEERDDEALQLENEEEAEKNELRAEPSKKRGRSKKKAAKAKGKKDDTEEASPLPVRRRLTFDDLDEDFSFFMALCEFCACVTKIDMCTCACVQDLAPAEYGEDDSWHGMGKMKDDAKKKKIKVKKSGHIMKSGIRAKAKARQNKFEAAREVAQLEEEIEDFDVDEATLLCKHDAT